jgi:hypothetical protein
MEAHETPERIEQSHEHGNQRVALLIVVLAAFLAITEMGGKGAQNHFTAKSIEANDLWAFFQAKTIRQTTLRTAAELVEAVLPEDLSAERRALAERRTRQWNDTVARYEEDDKNEGRKQLVQRAQAAEAERAHALTAYHSFEYASAGFQLAIVLASASVITKLKWIALVSAGLGAIATIISAIGFVAPNSLHW